MKLNVVAISLIFLLVGGASSQDRPKSSRCERGEISEKNYLFYDINPGEGFNLRRDVYMRLAVLVKNLRETSDWVLVLPPWGPLFHWKSEDLGRQTKLNWSLFFSVESLRKFVPVIELSEFVRDRKKVIIDQVIVLSHFVDGWDNGKWEEKYEFAKCKSNSVYRKETDGLVEGWFWKYTNIKGGSLRCLSFQGHASKLSPVLQKLSNESQHTIMVDRAEILLHDDYGSVDYWKVRRSMRFSDRLYWLAGQFRREHLRTDDQQDATVLPDDWRDEDDAKRIEARGGDYVCGHLRRQDFLIGRSHEVPSLKAAAQRLVQVAELVAVDTVFIASDGTDQEMEELRGHLKGEGRRLVLYRPPLDIRREIRDGGVAIVEQIICSRARHFIGSFESTFSFRIQEEREILKFPAQSTFNRFCGDGQMQCEQPAQWRILY